MADGGQPSHPVSLGFDVLDNPGEYEDILWFWHFDYDTSMHEFRIQLITWEGFRKYQAKMRGWYVSRNRFREYKNAIRESQEDVQCTWNLTVNEDRHTQNRFQDWIEFRAFYYRKLKAQRKRLEPAEKKYLEIQKELDDLEPDLSVPTLEHDDFSLAKAIEADKIMTNARDRVEAAERKLQQARSKIASVEETEQELWLARKLLELQGKLLGAKVDLKQERRYVKKWTVFLRWIDDQYSAIATKCGYCANGVVNDASDSSGTAYTKTDGS